MSEGLLLSPDPILSVPDAPPSVGPDPAFLPDLVSFDETIVVPHDTWGAITIPTGATGVTSSDPAIDVVLAFLKAWLVTDANLTVAWKAVYPALPPVVRTFSHDPSEWVFNTANLPALFMWRENAIQEYAADDWLRDVTTVKALWVYPKGLPENQRIRQPFVNAFTKSVGVGIERGRTPAFIVAGDPDPDALTQGSLFYPFAAFESFELDSWRLTKLTIPNVAGPPARGDELPAVELTFTMHENLVYGTDRFDPLSQNYGGFLTMTNDAGDLVDAGPI